MQTFKWLCKHTILFLLGGCMYLAIELAWRGYSHPSMFVLGGICFVIVGLINQVLPRNTGLFWQSIIGASFITAAELVTGLIVNRWLGLQVWDYSHLPYNLFGQVSLRYFFLWIVLAAVAIWVDDRIRKWLFGETPPKYKLF